MLHPLPASPDGKPAVLAFACAACGTGLEVPVALAGVTGPCPVCAAQITAPAAAVPAARVSELLTRPPRLREMPPPEPPPEKAKQNRVAAVRPEPLTSPRPEPGIQPKHNEATASTRTQPPGPQKGERGVFAGNTLHEDANELVHRRPVVFRRRGLMRWADLGIVGTFTGLCVACLAAMRYTVPARDQSLPGLPPNLNELVEKDAYERQMHQAEMEMMAKGSVKRFLSCEDEQSAASHLLPPPDGLVMPAFRAFPDFREAGADGLMAQSGRIPGTDRYLVMLKPPQAPGPVFVVEETDRGLLLHSGAITQQAAGLFEKFIAAPAEGTEVTLYAEARPALARNEREFRAAHPNLSGCQLLDFRPLGKEEGLPVCLPVGGAAAQSFARRAHDPGWRRCVATLRWAKDAGGADYVEITKFQPGAWSGDIPRPSSALTAGR